MSNCVHKNIKRDFFFSSLHNTYLIRKRVNSYSENVNFVYVETK